MPPTRLLERLLAALHVAPPPRAGRHPSSLASAGSQRGVLLGLGAPCGRQPAPAPISLGSSSATCDRGGALPVVRDVRNPNGSAEFGNCPSVGGFLKERKMADFEMIEGGPAFVAVRHLSENHRYSFIVARREGKRYLGEVAILEGGLGKHSAEHFSADARAFAERVASKAGLIDESRESLALHKGGDWCNTVRPRLSVTPTFARYGRSQ
jgi:hypothetical protein